jgi:hypothetical protein
MSPAEFAERHRVIMELDTEAFAKTIGHEGLDPTILLIAMHKVRYEMTTIPDEKRHESRAWLEARYLNRMGGKSWPPAGVLHR